jgi:hypothetical protein
LGACLAIGIAPGCAVSCLSLAAAAFPQMGPRQSSILFLSYTVTVLLGAAPVVQRWRPPMRAAAGGAALVSLYPASLALARLPPAAPPGLLLAPSAAAGARPRGRTGNQRSSLLMLPSSSLPRPLPRTSPS